MDKSCNMTYSYDESQQTDFITFDYQKQNTFLKCDWLK